MKESEGVKNSFFSGAAGAVPIAVGYVPIAIAFGVISVQSGIPLLHSVLMSLMVFAGASQFMAANMVLTGAGGIEIVLAVFVLNLRHFIMSMSLMNSFKHIPKKWKPLLSFGITDETFALLSISGRNSNSEPGQYYAAGLMLTAYSAWVLGTFVGGFFAGIIPASIGSSMSIGLYAMFIGLLAPAVWGAWRLGIIAVSAMLLNLVFSLFLKQGWAIIASTIFAAFIGIVLQEEGKET